MLALESKKNVVRAAIAGFSLGLLIVSLPMAAQAGAAKSHDIDVNLGLSVGHEVSKSDLGLPIYPGARPHKDNAEDESSANVKIMAGVFGLRVAAVKLESNDPPAKIVPFYRQALAKYGKVLDCSDAANRNGGSAANGLDCKDEHPEQGEVTLKAGTKHDQHVVGVKPNGKGSVIALVYVQIQGVDK